jgi:hypothetical protein
MPRNEPDLCKVFACSLCCQISYWTRSTPDEAMFCVRCRCPDCLGLMAFQAGERGSVDAYCTSFIRAVSPAAAVN